MTRAGAHETACGMAARFGEPFLVYRLPAWPDTAFAVARADRELPPAVIIVERCEAAPRPPAPDAQRSLFS